MVISFTKNNFMPMVIHQFGYTQHDMMTEY